MTVLSISEHPSNTYAPRTKHNARTADVTVAFAVDFETPGERLTRKAAADRYIALPLWKGGLDPASVLASARELFRFVRARNCRTLNVAGNGLQTMSKHGLQQADVNRFVFSVISQVHRFHPLKRIVSGGQTGADIAGAVAGHALGLDVDVLLPKGFLQRDALGVDSTRTREDVEQQIIRGASDLGLPSM